MSGEIVPKLSEALSAAAGAPVVAEATKRGKAVVAAAKGELELPKEKKRGWLKWLLLVAGLAGVAVFVVRKILGGKDADWQAARPTTPYAPPKPAQTAGTATGTGAGTPVVDAMDDEDAHEDPQGGMSAHLLNLEADGAAMPDQPAEGGDYGAPANMTSNVEGAPADLTTSVDEAFAEAADRIGVEAPADITGAGDATLSEMPPRGDETPTDTTLAPEAGETGVRGEGPAESIPGGDQAGAVLSEPAAALDARAQRYQGEGVYVGSEPPEGFTIKGNERSMKYHVPASAGYGRTVAEVWFNSEEAAQQAGFMRAQR
jgi:hypothetical protein